MEHDRGPAYRRPWYWLVLLALSVVAALAAIAVAAWSRIETNDEAADAMQDLEFQRVQTVANDFFSDAAQLAEIEASTVARVHGSRALVESLLSGMTEARRNQSVYGLGVFFAPHAFDQRTLLYGPYVRKIDGEISAVINSDAKSYDYPKLSWYRAAVAARGRLTIIGPYKELGTSFISALVAVYWHGSLRGVATVDARTAVFLRGLDAGLRPDEIAFIAGRNGAVFVSTSALPNNRAGWRDVSGPVRYTHSVLHVITDMRPVLRSDRQIIAVAVALAALVLFFAAALLGFIFRLWRSREAALALAERETTLRREIATRAEVEARLRAAAFTDELTGLPNRAYLRDRAAAAIEERTPLSLFLIDLDRFNIVNETFGHPAGDELLRMVADRLRMTELGTPMRLGGDEFLVLFSGTAVPAAVAERILAVIQEPFSLRGTELYLGASIGIVSGDDTYTHADEYLRDADIALYEAKRAGRGRAVDFAPAMRVRASDELALEAELRRAIERNEFEPYYQPIIDGETGDVASFEALVRWTGGPRGLVGAESFIAFSEQRGLIAQIDDIMLQLVARDAPAIFSRYPAAKIAVNVSAAHLSDRRLIGEVRSALERANLDASQLRIEITETAIMRNPEGSLDVLLALREMGVRIVVDDFGAGHSSLAYLQRLPISGLKIDRSFITPLATDSHARAIVRSIVALGESLDMYIVAEGIEDHIQAVAARELGVQYLQGFFFSKPLPLSEIAAGDSEPHTIRVS